MSNPLNNVPVYTTVKALAPIFREYFGRLKLLSGARGKRGYDVDGVYFPNNESDYSVAFQGHRSIVSRGGVYIGTSMELNLSHMAHQKASVGYVIDRNPAVTEIALPILGFLLLTSASRNHFLARLFACDPSPRLLDIWKFDSPELVDGILEGQFNKGLATQITYQLNDLIGAPEAITNFLGRFHNPAKESLEDPSSLVETIQKLGYLWHDGNQGPGGFMSSENAFQAVRRLWHERKVRAVTGELDGSALRRVGQQLHQQQKSVRVIYLSNVEDHFVEDALYESLEGLHQNILGLPRDEQTIVVSATPDGKNTMALSAEEYLKFIRIPDDKHKLYRQVLQHVARGMIAYLCWPKARDDRASRLAKLNSWQMLEKWPLPPGRRRSIARRVEDKLTGFLAAKEKLQRDGDDYRQQLIDLYFDQPSG